MAKIDGPWTSPDTTPVTINGWTTTSTNYIKIYTTPTARHNGKWDNNKYSIRITTTSLYPVEIDISNVIVDGLMLDYGYAQSYRGGIYIYSASYAVNNVTVSNSIIRTTINQSNNIGIFLGGGSYGQANIKIYNNIVYGFTGTNSACISNNAGSNQYVYIYNNTVYGCNIGINTFYGYNGAVAKNNIAQSSIDGYNGAFNPVSNYNISDIALDNTGGVNDKQATVSFVDVVNKDFHLSPLDTAAKGAGINLSSDANLAFNNDIDSLWRGPIWDIGADQLQDIFISLPDSSGACASYSLPILPSGWAYRCFVSSTLTKTNGTGWIPVDFTKISGNALSFLPVDPKNLSVNGQYYTFVTDGKKWELTSILESDKNKGVDNIGGKDGGQNVNILEIGTDLTLTPSVVKTRNQ